MKKNVMLLSCAALLALALAGCSQSTAQADYIGTDAAKAIALEAAGIGEADATFTTAELETRNNTPYYEVDFTAGGQEYDYDIDALTGTVIAGSQQAAGSTGNTDGSTGDTAITADKAKEIALNHAGVKAADAIFVKAGLDWDDGRTEYEVEFYAGNTEYDYSIDATTGAIRSYDHDWDDFSLWNPGNNAANPSTPGTSTNNLISEAKAKEIALAKAPSGASVVRCHLDWDDGRYIYEIKMVSGTMEYECDINAATGVITDWDVDSIYD